MIEDFPLYGPALRMKAGELLGTARLASDVADCVLPRWIVPPPKERDDEQALLFALARRPEISKQLLNGWGRRASFIDVGWIIDEFGRDSISNWLPAMFGSARAAGCAPIPSASIHDLGQRETPAFRECLPKESVLKFGLIIPAGYIEEANARVSIERTLNELGISDRQCAIIVDGSDLDFSSIENTAPVLEGVLESLQEMGIWQKVIFQGTNYPEVNPAVENGDTRVARNEWLAWKRAVKFAPETANNMVFGDFCADCSRIAFSPSGARPIPHIRYATDEAWLVVRGKRDGNSNDEMRKVFNALVASSDFAGRHSSSADEFIFLAARDTTRGCGNSMIWRQLNTTRHITQAVTDIAKVRGIDIQPLPVPKEEIQVPLF